MAWGQKPKKAAVPAPAPVAPLEEVVEETKHSPSAQARIEWHRLRASKGWSDARAGEAMYEFILARDLFAELNKFTWSRRL